jgi:4'-phosphopantetheinyl transferase
MAALAKRDLWHALEREVHVWLTTPMGLHDPSFAAALANLDADEREQAKAFVFDRDRCLYVSAHALVRNTLSRYLDLAPQAWRFATNKYGRPEIDLAHAPPLRFNLSHTNGLIACAVHSAIDTGVDVEGIRPLNDLDGVAQYSFSPEEHADVRAAADSDRPRRFFCYWTLKEAYIKARGMGLSLPTTQFTLRLDAPTIDIRFAPALQDTPADWQFFLDCPTPDHLLALAIRRGAGADKRIVQRWTDPLGQTQVASAAHLRRAGG